MSKITEKIQIVHLTTDSAIGGTERMISDIAFALDKKRFESTVVTLIGGGELENVCMERNISYKSLNMRSKLDLLAVIRLFFLLKRMNIDILHTYLFHANILGRIIGKILSVPVVVSGQRNVDVWRKWYHNFLDKLTYRLSDKIISNSKAGKDFLVESVGLKPDNIDVIYNGVDPLDARNNDPREKLCLTTVASLTLKKGHIYLLEALGRIKNIDFEFFVIGEGTEKVFLENRAEKLGLKEKIFFEGYQKSIASYIIKTDIFVLPSLWEGLPVALMEAMSCGLPCIASNVGGIGELIEHMTDGLLVEPKNVDQLEQAITKLLNDKKLRFFLGNNAKNRIETAFSKNKMIDNLEKTYTELLKK